MINFYTFYNKTGLDFEEYSPLIDKLKGMTAYDIYTIELEPIKNIIKRIPKHAYWYSRDVIKGRWSEAEKYIITDTQWSYCYAWRVICGRWPEAEPYIMTDSSVAWRYTSDVIKGRWIEAEEYIMKNNPWNIIVYAVYALKHRWIEAEPYIMEEPFWSEYCRYFEI